MLKRAQAQVISVRQKCWVNTIIVSGVFGGFVRRRLLAETTEFESGVASFSRVNFKI